MSDTSHDHFYLVDGSSFIFRAYHALPALTRKSDGMPVGAVAGFSNMIYKILTDFTDDDRPSHIAVIFDASRHSFRNEFFPDYKAHRPEAPEDLVPQFALIREATKAFGLPCIEIEGYEADDVIATYARSAAAKGAEVTIVSSDKDLMQLVSDRIELLDPMKNRRIRPEQVVEKFGVGPEKVIDVQALAGDSVDNIPGAPGIGVKTAALLINEYGDLDTLLARAEEIRQPKRRQSLIDNEEQIRISRRLVTLDDKVPDLPPCEELRLHPLDGDRLLAFLNEMEFNTLARRIAEKHGLDAPAPKKTATGENGPVVPPGADAAAPIDTSAYEIVRDADTLRAWVAEVYERGEVAIDTETTSLDEMRAELVGVCLATRPGRACYAPLGHVEGDGDLLGEARLAPGQIPLEEALEILKPMLEDDSVLKIAQNVKYDYKVLLRYGVRMAPFDDTMLLSYAEEAGRGGHGMDALSERHLGHKPISIKSLIGSGKSQITFDRLAIDKAAPYAAEDADVTLRLWKILKPGLVKNRVTRVYETMERPLVPVLADMEMRGVLVDRDRLSRLSNAFAQKMAALEAEIQELAGEKFNVGSPKQLGEILFDKMGLDGGKKGKTGAYSTGADVLETLAAEGVEIAARVLDWRQLSKLKGTYTDALQQHINPETGRVHTSYSIAGASTGRLASTDPNLQNIPVRTEEGRRIREAFIAPEGKVLISLDYSQIELRLLAHIADIPELKKAFAEGQDIHAATASQMFGVPIEGMDPMVRRRAKAINFGVIYGISPYGLANNLRISREEAKAFIDSYFEKFPGIRDYMDRTVETAKRQGYVETLFGRKIHTPDINARGPKAGFQQRAAINAPIQGSAADVIRRAMVRIPGAIEAAGLSAAMLLQVHDELIFEAPEDEAEAVIGTARRVMENAPLPAVRLSTPLVVDAGTGANWAEAH